MDNGSHQPARQGWAFRHIGHRILALVGLALLVGFLGITTFHARHQEKSTLAQNERIMGLWTQSISRGLQTVMLAGYADIAQAYAESLRNTPGVIDFHILRTNGQEAFLDNHTIAAVNRRIGEEEFLPREEESSNRLYQESDPLFHQVATGSEAVTLYQRLANGEGALTFLLPIPIQEKCYRCHGSQEKVRGVVKLTTSLAQVEADIAETRQNSLFISVANMALILLLTFFLIRRSVVRPIARMTQAMARVAAGDLAHRVLVPGQDELGQMAVSFNSMAAELLRSYTGLQQERDKLTTIILSAREGIVVTDRTGEVVLVNPATERHLGKERERIVREGFLNLLDDPAYLQAFLDRKMEDIPETIVYNSRVFHFYASTIRTTDNEIVGSAALFRDITEEKRLEEQLRTLSTTDGLTGLLNRRRFDEALADELNRARRYKTGMALLLLDVDHFKKFNDQYGHDQGDRVLQSLARVMKGHFRQVDYACRYGGEEFCAILPNTQAEGAVLAADRLRQKVEEMVVDGLKVTISVGVAVFPDGPSEPEPLLKAADEALYHSKRGGRNRVTCLRPELGKPETTA